MKQRHEFYLDEDVSEALTRLARQPGASKSAIMTAALRAYLDRRATNELDDRFKGRLDRLQAQLQRIARDEQIIAESLGIFVHTFILNMPAGSTADRETQLRARQRFEIFLKLVSQRISTGPGLIEDVLKLVSAQPIVTGPETKQ